MRYTKIIATLGPASDGPGIIDALIAAGADVFRLNFSHGTDAEHAARFARCIPAVSVRSASDGGRMSCASDEGSCMCARV